MKNDSKSELSWSISINSSAIKTSNGKNVNPHLDDDQLAAFVNNVLTHVADNKHWNWGQSYGQSNHRSDD